MHKIVQARFLGRNIKMFEIEAPRIAKKQRPGQFVIVRLYDRGERIPLTIEDSKPEKGTITLVVQSIGKTTHLMNSLEAGDSMLDVVGPLGKPSEIENYGTAVVIGGSVGTAIALPVARALKARRQSRHRHYRLAHQGPAHPGERAARRQATRPTS